MKLRQIGIAALTVFCLVFSSACKNDTPDELFEFTHVLDFGIPAGLNTLDTHFFLIPNVNTLVDDQLAATGLSLDDIGTITPKFCRFSTVFEDEDLDFIRLIEIRVIDQFDPDIRREVFYLDPVPTNSREVIRPFPGLADVKEIVSRPSFAVEVRLRFWRPPPRSYDIRMSLEFAAFE